MADETAKKIAEAKAKMFGTKQPSTEKILLMVSGAGRVETQNKKLEIRQVPL